MSNLGELWLRFYHRPIGKFRTSWRNGGPWVVKETEKQRLAMEEAAKSLGSLPVFPGKSSVRLYFVTGRRFWYQTAYCLHSFARTSERTIEADIYDDGTLQGEILEELRQLGPTVRIHPHAEILARLDKHLPTAKFPTLRERWINYPNIRKLIDVHLGSQGNKLVLDSDLLFFRRPQALIDWYDRPVGSLTAIDCSESYGYSRSLMERLAGCPIPPLVNVGICGLDSSLIDWPEMEAWCTTLIAEERTNYYLEQAIVAMYVARETQRSIAPANDYITMPNESEVRHPTAAMHHYVDISKRWYFRYGWKTAMP